MTELKTRIKELRLENGLTLKELGEKIGVKDNTLSQYENDKRTVPYQVLVNISLYFECSIDYLLRKTGPEDEIDIKFMKLSRIKQLREEKGISQKELAQKINIPTKTIELYETAKYFPRIDVWENMAKIFDVDVPYLQGATSDEERKTNYEWNHLGEEKNKSDHIDTENTKVEEYLSENFFKLFGINIDKSDNERTSISFPNNSLSDEQLTYLFGLIAKFMTENNNDNKE
ncbi:MAG: helix-turn-helix transcriptional regulator [Weissella hellenica]|uniref:helix-turn-helix transcriptional regulator n=1 Tax=Weissella hellenica TaxID=46256 RepID=UPI003F9991F8